MVTNLAELEVALEGAETRRDRIERRAKRARGRASTSSAATFLDGGWKRANRLSDQPVVDAAMALSAYWRGQDERREWDFEAACGLRADMLREQP